MKKIENLLPLVRPYYNGTDPAHDWAHVCRVAANAEKLVIGLELNTECVLAAVYCHDLINLPKNHPDRAQASNLSREESLPLLRSCGFSEEEIALIACAILEHSYSKGLKPSCLEAAVVQDADRLDALGAIGILRCAAVNAQMKSTFYDPLDPLADKRSLDDKSFMLDHYFEKLYRLPELMNTQRAKIMAHERVEVMKTFVEQLMQEISSCG